VHLLGRPVPGWAGPVLRFLAVGGSAAALDAVVLSAQIAHGVSPYAARVGSLAVTVVYTWVLNRRVTFRTTAPPSWREFGHYLLTALGGMVLNYVLYSGLLRLGAAVWLAFVIGTGLTAVYSFLRYRAVFAARR